MKRCGTDRVYLAVIAVVLMALSLGCFLFDKDPKPDPDPAQDECNGMDAIPEIVDEDFTADDDCDVVDDVVIVDGARLSVEPGTTLEFARGAGLRIESGGSLYARGDEEPITFTGVDEEPGSWVGIYFEESMSRDNIIEEAIVEFGGQATWDDETPVGPANIAVRDSRVELVDVTLRNSGANGLYMTGDSAVAIGGDNAWTQNREAPVRTTPSLVASLSGETTYRGNDEDFIYVTEGTIDEHARWARFDVPLRLAGTIFVEANLRIAGGNELIFDEGAAIEIGDDGDLEMDADGHQEVTLRGSGADEDAEIRMDNDLNLRSVCLVYDDHRGMRADNDRCP